MTTAPELRQALVAELAEKGDLTDAAWTKAAEAVPRELFVGAYFRERPDTMPTAYDAVHPGQPGWLEAVYSNRTLITQLDGEHRAENTGPGPVTGVPASSSTLPSLVLGMWQRLAPEPGHRVLEIGTGTGYSTALGTHVLGDANLTSVEYDPALARRAEDALNRAGYAPRLLTGDGLAPVDDDRPFDRIIATCSVRYIPQPWLHQVRPGGKILVTIAGWGFGFGLALITVTSPGHASGRFEPGYTSFMMARPHDHPPRQGLNLLPGQERDTRIDPETISTWTGSWIAQLAAPSAERVGTGAQQILNDVATGSQARTAPKPDGGWTVIQRGPLRLWDQVEDAILTWQQAGSPHQEHFGITISPQAQRVWLGSEDGPGWNLPV